MTGLFKEELYIGSAILYFFNDEAELDVLKQRMLREVEGIVSKNLPGRISPEDLADLYIKLNPVMVEFQISSETTRWREGMAKLCEAAARANGYEALAVAVRGSSEGHARKKLEWILREELELPEWGTTSELPSWY